MTLELWSDPAGDGDAELLLSAGGRAAPARWRTRMGIPHFTLDLRDRFRGDVVDDFLAGYAAGHTPNPCVRCNGLVRFDSMLDLRRPPGRRQARHRPLRAHRATTAPARLVRMAVDPHKDQSYVLSRLGQETLERVGFPLGAYAKPEVRELARRAGLPVADKPESQDLCFLAGTERDAFVRVTAASAACRTAKATSSTARAGCSAPSPATTASRSASGAASACRPTSRSTCSPRMPAATGSSWAPASSS